MKISANAKIYYLYLLIRRAPRHLPRHGKADRFASADNRGEDSKSILFLFVYFLLYYYTAIPSDWICHFIKTHCHTEYAALLNMLPY